MSPRTVPGPLAPFVKDQLMHLLAPAASPTSGSAGGWRRPLGARAAAVFAAVAATFVGLGLASAPAMADDCPNAALRAQNNSTQLPDCRAYEQVTPVFKEAFGTFPTIFTDDGRLIYRSNGNFADNGLGSARDGGGNHYVAVRSASGWSTTALAPSAPDYYTDEALAQLFSRDLRSSLWQMRRGDEPVDVSDLYLERPAGVFTRLGSLGNPLARPTLTSNFPSFAASDDMSHVVFTVDAALAYPGTDAPASGTAGPYEYVGTAHDDPPRLVSVNNAGQQIDPGCGQGDLKTISGDGRVIVWASTCAGQVWARIDGTTTIAVSGSECTRAPSDPGGACDAPGPAVFRGASADGTRVYFTTAQQLVNGDTDATDDLYECDVPTGTPAPVGTANPCSELRLISGAQSGADVQAITRISDDGSRVYFVAAGVLASNPGANDATAVAGDENLYVWHSDAGPPGGETRFVAKLDPADGAGGYAETTGDGHYLVFATHAALIDHGPQADTDTAQDLYRYDAESGALTRLSTDEDGSGGNDSGHDAQFSPISPVSLSPRLVMSDDGGSVVFFSDDALAPEDTNGTIDTYLWHDGRASLLSSGKPSDDHSYSLNFRGLAAGISSSGRDVYFTTTARLAPNDVDTQLDVYDAHIDGGFDLSVPPPCNGDGCQGGSSAPSSSPSQSGSSSAQAEGNPSQATPTFTVGKLSASQLKRVASTGKVSLSVATNAPGVLLAKATATIAKRSTTVGSARRSVAKAGTVSLSLTLSKKARAELKSKRKLSVKVLVSQSNVAIARTVSLKLTQPKAAKKAKRTKKQSSRTTSRHAVSKGGRS
jgi:hypothetical protein